MIQDVHNPKGQYCFLIVSRWKSWAEKLQWYDYEGTHMTDKQDTTPGTGKGALDPVREAVQQALTSRGLSLKQASRALGRNDAYLHQFLYRRSPRRLPEELRHALAALLECDQALFLEQGTSKHHSPSAILPGQLDPRAQIAFVDITASAGGGAMNEPGASDPTQNLAIPTAMLRKITTSPSSELRIITISGDSMAPVLEHGDIVMVDCAQTRPSPPGIFIVDDGIGLVAKRVDLIPNTTPQMLRLTSENNLYTNYQRRIDEVQIIGRVVWFARSL